MVNLWHYLVDHQPEPEPLPEIDACPVLALLPPGNFVRPALSAPRWQVRLMRQMFPDCQRLDGSGVCMTCQHDVQGVHVLGEPGADPYAARPDDGPLAPIPFPAPPSAPTPSLKMAPDEPPDDPPSGPHLEGRWRPL